LWEQKMVAKDTSYGSETHRPYLDIERIINVQSACSVNRGHDLNFQVWLFIDQSYDIAFSLFYLDDLSIFFHL
jgi:hypothetical protein